MSHPTDEHTRLCRVYGPAPVVVHELTPAVSDFDFWWGRLDDRWGEVVFGLVRNDGRMILTRATDYPPGVFRVPSGGIKHGETAIDALYREVDEEIGLRFGIIRYAGQVEFRFSSAAGTIVFPSYCFILGERHERQIADSSPPTATGETACAGDGAGEIESWREVSLLQLPPVLTGLAGLASAWADWGRYRARTGALIAEGWQAWLAEEKHNPGGGPVDVSRPVHPGMECYPGDEPPSRCLLMARDGGSSPQGWEVSRWSLSAHAGTHVDAPAHLFAHGETIDRIDLARLVGPAVVVDCRRAAAAGRAVQPGDLPAEQCLRDRIVLIALGLGGGMALAECGLESAGLSVAAARYLIAAGPRSVGIDSLSVDPSDAGFQVHTELLSAGIPVIEGLDLRGVEPGEDWWFAGQPLRLAGSEAAPCRAIVLPIGPAVAAAERRQVERR